MARVALIGVGAMGSVAAALLEEAGHEVLLCVRRPLPELTIERESGPVRVRARRLESVSAASPVDWILVATKTYDVPGAAAWLGPLGAGGCPVAVLQNGVEHRERFAPYLPPERIVPVVVDCGARRMGPAVVRQRTVMHLTVADDVRGRGFVGLFAGSAADAVATNDFTSAVWRKLCMNSAGVLNALLLRTNEVFHDDAVAETGRQIVRETVSVGRAEGAALEDGLADEIVQKIRSSPPETANSIYIDRMAGGPTEIDARNGAVVRIGRRRGVAAPCNQMAVMLIEASRPTIAAQGR